MVDPKVRVLKFGSSVLGRDEDLSLAVHEVYRSLREGIRVIAVVSAIGSTTDALVARADRLGSGDASARALLVSTGETAAVGMLTLALDRAGIPAEPFDGARLGIRTAGPGLDARPIGFDAAPLRRAFDRASVVVVPGFVGRDPDGGVSLLGRGGSDLTAVLLSMALGAECALLKDVDGIYERDPGTVGATPRRYESIPWTKALGVGGGVVQARALEWARRSGTPIRVARCGEDHGTRVGEGCEGRAASSRGSRVLRVGLLGFGTVGRAVMEELERDPVGFETVGVLVRDGGARQAGLRPGLAHDSVEGVLAKAPDVVVEALPGGAFAEAALIRVLGAGLDVVSANKEVFSRCGSRLESLAREQGASLGVSAAVGGSLPVLETLSRCRREGDPVVRVEGVLNGTTNYILDRMGQGTGLADALVEAQERGLAERNAERDLGGHDVVAKLTIAARAAVPGQVQVDVGALHGIDGLDARRVWMARTQGRATRLLGRLAIEEDRARIDVAPIEFELETPWARCTGASNRVRLVRASGEEVVLEGLGAGGVPTATSILGDLHALRRSRSSRATRGGDPLRGLEGASPDPRESALRLRGVAG